MRNVCSNDYQKLLNCPFCGGDKNHRDDCYIPMLVEYVRRNQFIEQDDEKKLEKAWNTRVEKTCKVTPSKNLQGIVVCECGEPFPEYYDYCPYCGEKVEE